MKRIRIISTLAVATLALSTLPTPAQVLTVLHSFTNSPDGSEPYAGLTVGGQVLYGTTHMGGTNGSGIVFALGTDGNGFTVLHDFTHPPDGATPFGGLLLAGDTLYGTTALGGSGTNWGTIFSLKTNGGGYAVLHSFDSSPANSQHPHGRLVLSGTNLFGTAYGGASPGWGSVFSQSTDGSTFSVLHTFTTPFQGFLFISNWDGVIPWAGVVLAGQTLYGTTHEGGTNGGGTVYSLNTDGNDFTVLHTFTNSPDGQFPQGGLILSGDTLYGTTEKGGSQGRGLVFSLKTNGTAFTPLYSFLTNGVDGSDPWGELALFGNTIYGTTSRGGTLGRGTVFALNTDGSAYTLVHSFTNTPDGEIAYGALMVAGGTLYGTTYGGGAAGWGTVFSLAVAAPAPVITSLSFAGSDLLITATNGVAGRAYALLTSQDLTLPLSLWTPITTNMLSTGGNFSIIATNVVNLAAAQAFYLLRVQ